MSIGFAFPRLILPYTCRNRTKLLRNAPIGRRVTWSEFMDAGKMHVLPRGDMLQLCPLVHDDKAGSPCRLAPGG